MKKIISTLLLATLTQIGFSQDITNSANYSRIGENNEMIYFLNYKAFSYPKMNDGKVLFGSTVKMQKKEDGNVKYFYMFLDDFKSCIENHGNLLVYGLDNTYIDSVKWTLNDWESKTNGGISSIGYSLCAEVMKRMKEDSKKFNK